MRFGGASAAWLLSLALVACGRVGFDPRLRDSAATDAHAADADLDASAIDAPTPPGDAGGDATTPDGSDVDSEQCDGDDDDRDGFIDEDFDLLHDDLNCGACGSACGEGGSCHAGRCLAGPRSLSVGGQLACVVTAENVVECWGDARFGALGAVEVPVPAARTPRSVRGAPPSLAVAAGWNHVCALATSNEVWCWGYGASGQLGRGDRWSSPTPMRVTVAEEMPLTDVVELDSGYVFSCARDRRGGVACWGDNASGQSGRTSTETSVVHATAIALPGPASRIVLGVGHACAIVEGAVYCWGSNANGQLGDGTNADSHVPVRAGTLTGIEHLTAGWVFTCAGRSSGELWCWGDGSRGQLGRDELTSSSTPVLSRALSGIVQLAASEQTAFAITASGTNVNWGAYWDGIRAQALVAFDTISSARTEFATAAPFVALDGFYRNACGVRADGGVDCWGWYAYGTLGDAVPLGSEAPVTVGVVGAAAKLACGADFTCVVDEMGRTGCFGDNTAAQLGGGYGRRPSSSLVRPMLSGATAIAVAAGRNAACVVTAAREVVCWGAPDSPALGRDPPDGSPLPRAVAGATDSAYVAVGANHACHRLETGGLECWGRNSQGQFGNDSTTSSALPVMAFGALLGADLYADVATTETATCATTVDGIVRCAGDGYLGQTGIGRTSMTTTPLEVVGLPAVDLGSLESASSGHTYCATAGGTPYCWGGNGYGQLGVGDREAQLSATSVGPEAMMIDTMDVAVGGTATCLLNTSQQVYCAGDNTFRQLGVADDSSAALDYTKVDDLSPHQYVRVCGGSAHFCGVQADGTLSCWGALNHGQLGGDLPYGRATPSRAWRP